MPHSSTQTFENATPPCTLGIADRDWRSAMTANPSLANGANVVEDRITLLPAAEADHLSWTPLDSLLA